MSNRPGHSLRATVPAWVQLYDPDVHGDNDPDVRGDDLDPPQPSARPDITKGVNHLKRRVSKDGYVSWVDEKHDHVSKLPVFLRKRADRPGRRWDHLRSAEPVIMGLGYRDPHEDPYARWRDFIRSSSYGRNLDDEWEVMPQDTLEEQMPGLEKPVRIPLHPLDPKARQSRKKTILNKLRDFALRHPIAPLIFRLTVLITSMASLGLAIKIFRREKDNDVPTADAPETSQAIVTLIIDVVAIPYIAYMTWDEYTGKPIGLRPPGQKVSLTLLDLIFIVFKSASTALAFEALVYHTGDGNAANEAVKAAEQKNIHMAQGLAALITVGLISWVLNFTISVFRLAEKLGGLDTAVIPR